MLNKNILKIDFQLFIIDNKNTEITDLILRGNHFEGVSTQEVANQFVSKHKSEKKLPTWYNSLEVYYPPKVSIEQTSSEITANYKATILSGTSIIDITGGFGVDCYYFSKVFKSVTHCEINNELSEIVAHNFNVLGTKNIEVIHQNGLEYLEQNKQSFDCIYIDPSRRNELKGKVFLLKDCLPNVPENLDFLFSKSKKIVIKNSPMLDISSTIKELSYVKEVHIVGVQNEVKELLFILEKGYSGEIKVKTINITKVKNQLFDFNFSDSPESVYSNPKKYLYEPNSSILKSGGFHQVSKKMNVLKLHKHSHLYTSDNLIDFPGRKFIITQVLPYNKKLLKGLIPEGKANITTRNFPKTVAQIRKETKLKDGGDKYLFFTKNIENKNIIIICLVAN